MNGNNLDNSAFDLLPSLLDIYSKERLVDSTISYVKNQITRIKDESPYRKTLIDLAHGLEELQANGKLDEFDDIMVNKFEENKSILLGLLFGNIATDALEIIDHNQVRFSGIDDVNSIKAYLQTGETSVPIMTTITQIIKTPKKQIDPTLENQIIEIEVNEALKRLNLTLLNDKLTLLNDRLLESSESSKHLQNQIQNQVQNFFIIETRNFHCDLFNWYCSCYEYHRCYTTSWIDHTPIKQEGVPVPKHFEPIKFDHINPIPLCCHLLALLIVRDNPKNINIDSHSFSYHLNPALN